MAKKSRMRAKVRATTPPATPPANAPALSAELAPLSGAAVVAGLGATEGTGSGCGATWAGLPRVVPLLPVPMPVFTGAAGEAEELGWM